MAAMRWPAMATAFSAGLLAGAVLAAVLNGSPAPAASTSNVAAGERPPIPQPSYPASVIRVIDGDTFEARVHVWPGLELITKVRLRDIDAPEHRGRCEGERAKAQAAHEALARLLSEGVVSVTRVGLDKYGGRVLADAATRSIPNVAVTLLAAGHARPYHGGRRQSWCEGQ
jgi:endonuclease YncB( thermonuclease family)